jgi:hypothetical protein
MGFLDGFPGVDGMVAWISNEVHWRFAIYVPWHRTGTYLVKLLTPQFLISFSSPPSSPKFFRTTIKNIDLPWTGGGGSTTGDA